jgi:hypothetical protein
MDWTGSVERWGPGGAGGKFRGPGEAGDVARMHEGPAVTLDCKQLSPIWIRYATRSSRGTGAEGPSGPRVWCPRTGQVRREGAALTVLVAGGPRVRRQPEQRHAELGRRGPRPGWHHRQP